MTGSAAPGDADHAAAVSGADHAVAVSGADHAVAVSGADHAVAVSGADHVVAVSKADHAVAVSGADHASAAAVKAQLLARLCGDQRLRGVGLSRVTESANFQVEVRVAEEQHIAELALPSRVDGVLVQVRAIGDISAAPAQ